jgi:predicted TPR repeat methyltransferase
VPEFLAEAIAEARPGRFGVALDLGCGTGLMGERLRAFCDRLEGFDISAEMLRKARAKRVYDGLEKADLQAFSYEGPKADLVSAADVFMYIGALEGVVKTVAGLLAEGGLFAFSVEKLDAADDFALQPSRRYAHAEGYVKRVLRQAGLTVVSLEEHIIRQDRNEPVTGLIVLAGQA